jgi:Transglycosylase SLT domain
MRRALGTYLLGAVLAGPIAGGFGYAQDGAVDPIISSTASSCTVADSAEIATLVRKIAVEEGFDPDLAEAVAFVESSLGQRQESGAGALGIMQLMPGTASDLGVADRCDPASNIRGGVRLPPTMRAPVASMKRAAFRNSTRRQNMSSRS